MDWTAPQWIMLSTLVFSALCGWLLHGKDIKINGWPKLIDAMLVAIVLYWGGFWS